MNKQKELDKIAKEIEKCKICKVGKSGKAVPGEGSPDAKVMFVGEAPGKTEAATGRPFIGRSGQLLRATISASGLYERDVYITSPVKYLPDRGTPTKSDILHGKIHLLKQIDIIDPKIIVLLGSVAVQGVLQSRIPPLKNHGKVIVHPSVNSGQARKYLVTIHPAAVLRFPKYKSLFLGDFKKLKSLIS